MTARVDPKRLWEESFEAQIQHFAYNTAPVEALVRSVSYYLRARHPMNDLRHLHFLEMGCGAGPNLLWLAQKGIRVSGVDIADNALALARAAFAQSGLAHRLGDLVEAPVTRTPFADGTFDGIVEACVFQHLDRHERRQAFGEVSRLLKPGGLFVGYVLDAGHTIFQQKAAAQLADDPGSLLLDSGSSKFHLGNIGLTHFYRRDEIIGLLAGFSEVDPGLTTYYLPREEARRRGYDEYLQSMWTIYAVK